MNLRRLHNESRTGLWDLYLPFAIFAYNSSVNSSTGFTPHFLTFGEEVRIPSELIVLSLTLNHGEFAGRLVSNIAGTFEAARQVLRQKQQRAKEWYDSGVTQRLFTPGDIVRLRIKNLFATPASKLASPWSSDYKVMRTRGVNVLVRNVRSGEETWVHHDRLSNPLVFRNVDVPSGDEAHDPDGVEFLPSEHNPDGNEALNPSTPNTDGSDTNNLLNTLAISLSASCSLLCAPNIFSNVSFALQSSANYAHALNCSLNNTTIGMHSNAKCGLALEFAGMMTSRSDLMLTTPVPLTTQQRALVDAMESEGWHIRWVSGVNRWMGMHPRSSTIYYLSFSQDRFVSLVVAPNGRAVYYTRLSDYEP